ncbi:hypothetical protein ES705_42962 [subsurface metagenome]|jgi:hypothetical protein
MLETEPELCAICREREAVLFFISTYHSEDLIGLCQHCHDEAEQSGNRDLFVHLKILSHQS